MNGKILIIDDEEDLKYSFQLILTGKGYHVTSAKDYDEAMVYIEKEEYDMIFADILLGNQTGIDFLRQVKRKGSTSPVIMITGSPDMDTALEAVRLGAFDYIPKPVLPETLLRVAKMALNHKRLVAEKNGFRLHLEAIFRSVSEGILSVDKALNIIEVNDTFMKTFTFRKDELVGKNLKRVGLPCGKKCIDMLTAAITEKRQIKTGRIEFRCRGKNFMIFVTASPLIDEHGKFSGAVLAVRDETRLAQLENNLNQRQSFHNMIGQSKALLKLFSLVEALADIDTTVLIIGESGVGKELVAKALHESGIRKNKPFIKVNCSALSESLLESELFGHVKGAFTGAIYDKAGRFEKAHGGTIFLDEIGDISSRMQVRLLRVLQEKEFEKVGDSTTVRVDVRVVAATHQDLREKVKKGEFREDLYYRLKVMELKIPPLRERKEDISLLVRSFINRYNEKFGKGVSGLSDNAKALFLEYSWPGNVRELEHCIEHAFILCHGSLIEKKHLPSDIVEKIPLKEETAEDEEKMILKALEKAGGNKAVAARILGIGRTTLYRKLEKYNIISPGN